MNRRLIIIFLIFVLILLFTPIPYYQKMSPACGTCTPSGLCALCESSGWKFKSPIVVELFRNFEK